MSLLTTTPPAGICELVMPLAMVMMSGLRSAP